MTVINQTDPKQFIAGFFTSFTNDLLSTDEDAAVIVDRYHTPDIVQVADGHLIDRDGLIAHTRPVRKRRTEARIEVHEAVTNGDLIAARYTLHARDAKRNLAIDVHFFGQFTGDGKMRRAHMLTRTVPRDS